MAGKVGTHTHFLKKDELYETEKPYSLRFTPPDGFPRANIKLERHAIEIEDVRKSGSRSFKRDGYGILDFQSQMTHKDFDDEETIQSLFLGEVANQLKAFLGARHVQIFEHTVRKRHEIFPISTGEPYRYNQPTSIAHVDTTLPWAIAMAHQLNGDKAPEMLKHRLQCVNFWKPLAGPVKDWPLALCVPETTEPEEDFEACDLVYPDYVVENRQVYYSKRQRWLYLSDQMPNEAWVFLQADTDPTTKPVAHTAFPFEDADPAHVTPRESIEVRALVYYGCFEED